MRRAGRTFFAVLGLVMLGAGLLAAQSGGAMLYANGDVKVNGQAAGYSTSIFGGDRVDVTASSAGSINRSGSSVVVGPNSSIQYDPASIQVIQGSARISTTKGMTAEAGGVVVSPSDPAAKFDVTTTGDKVVVTSREGALSVKDGDRTIAIQPGASSEFPVVAAGGAQIPSANSRASLLPPDQLAEHPFYGVVAGIPAQPPTLPICSSLQTCIRPSVSMIRPCCCPPRIMCN